MAFIEKYAIEILLSLVTAGALAFCRYMGKQMTEYRYLLDKREDEEIGKLVDRRLEPIMKELEELRTYIVQKESVDKNHLALVIASYKFRLVSLCKNFLAKGYMTQGEYDQLTEFFKLYEGLGGNGQAKEYYERTIVLPIHEDPPHNK